MINERFQEADDISIAGSVTPQVLRLDWGYTDRAMYAEMFTPDWSLLDQTVVTVVSATLGSPVVHVVNTTGLIVGQEYIIEGSNATQVVRVQSIDAVNKTVTMYSALSSDYTDGTIKRSNFLIFTGYAEGRYAKYYYLGPIDLGNRDSYKQVIVRRLDNNATLNVYYKSTSANAWVLASDITTGTADSNSIREDVYLLKEIRGIADIKLISNIAGYTEPLLLYSVFVLDPDIFKTISTSTIFYLSPTGSDSNGDGTSASPWYSIDKALDYLDPYWISADAAVTIRVAPGHYSYSDKISVNHSCGDRIFIKGTDNIDVEITGYVSAVAGALDPVTGLVSWAVTLDVGTTSGTFSYSVGDYLTIHTNTASDDFCVLFGCHKITSVDLGAGYITVTIKYPDGIAFPTPALCSFEGYLLKTVLSFPGGGIFLTGQKRIGVLENVVIEGSSASEVNGFVGISGYYRDVITLRRVGIVNFWQGMFMDSVLMHGYGPVSAEGTESGGAIAVSGCSYGITVATLIATVRVIAAGNYIGYWLRGFASYTFRNIGCIAIGNSGYGVFLSGGRIQAAGCIIGDNAPDAGAQIYASKGGYAVVEGYSSVGTDGGTELSPAGNTVGNEQGYIDT